MKWQWLGYTPSSERLISVGKLMNAVRSFRSIPIRGKQSAYLLPDARKTSPRWLKKGRFRRKSITEPTIPFKISWIRSLPLMWTPRPFRRPNAACWFVACNGGGFWAMWESGCVPSFFWLYFTVWWQAIKLYTFTIYRSTININQLYRSI